MKSDREKISILFVPEGEGESRSIRLSRGFIKLLIFGVILFSIALIAGIVSYFFISVKASQYDRMVEENLRLIEENRRIVELSEDLGRLQAFNRQIRRAMGVALDLDTLFVDTTDFSLPQNDMWSNGVFSGLGNPRFQLPLEGSVSRGFTHDLYPKQPHLGVDFSVPEGTLVNAAADGWVVFTGWHFRYGNLLIIQHTGDFITYYGHNRSILVGIGEKVGCGQPVAISGNSGRSTAPHLHFEIRRRGRALNPEIFINELSEEPVNSVDVTPGEREE